MNPDPTSDNIQTFFNSPPATQEGTRGDIQSLWSIVRKSLQRMVLSIAITGQEVNLDLPEGTITPNRRHLVSKVVRKELQSAKGYKNVIKINSGIRQGCPLSPLLFNLALKGILPQVEQMKGSCVFGCATRVKILAYADDLCIIGTSKEETNHTLQKIRAYIQWAGLRFNPAKSGSLSMINHRSRKYVDNFQPLLGSDLLPSLKWADVSRSAERQNVGEFSKGTR